MSILLSSIGMSGSASYDYYRYKRRCWSSDEDSDEDSDENPNDWSMYEVHECIEYLDTWIWMDDKRKELGRRVLDVETEMFQDENLFGDWEPNECSVEECCGNAGATMERWYSQAALVLWPHSKRVVIKLQSLLHSGIPSAVNHTVVVDLTT